VRGKGRLALVLAIAAILSISMPRLFFDSPAYLRVSAVITSVPLGVYWDANCSTPVYSIDWGNITVGGTKKITMYVRNEGNETFVLSVEAENWQAGNTSNVATFSSEEPKIGLGQTVQVNPSLTVFSNASGVSSFSFNVILYTTLVGMAFVLSDLDSLVIKAALNQAYFVYADPHRMTRAVATYDVASGSIIYSLCVNAQNQGFDARSDWVSQSASDKGRLLLSNKTCLMFGGWAPNWCVNYLQGKGLTPVSSLIQTVGGQPHMKFVNTKTGAVLVDILQSTDFEHQDYFVMMVLKDENGNEVFISYGFDWKGTWSAGIFLRAIYSNILAYTNQYYVMHWVDSNGDGIPQSVEMTQVATG